MKRENHLKQFMAALATSLADDSFIKATMGAYHGAESALRNIYLRKIQVQGKAKMGLTYRYATKDIVKNYSLEDTLPLIEGMLENDWLSMTIFTTQADHAYQRKKNGKTFFSTSRPTHKSGASLTHNREKKRPIDATRSYLHDLGITDDKGNVYKNAQDKYRQINKYIETLDSLISAMPDQIIRKIVDMGSGKGYLTFALYDHLQQKTAFPPVMTGIEYRPDLVALCNDIARNSGFEKLSFVEGAIKDADASGTDILIALHACDTATDEALYKGITAGTKLIVAAPCCHKQVRREMETGRTAAEIALLTRHGIFMERQAEMVTDGLRALILEYFGYDTKIFEFISDAHTPKNVMIAATLNPKNKVRNPDIRAKIMAMKAFYGVGTHHLEKLLEIA